MGSFINDVTHVVYECPQTYTWKGKTRKKGFRTGLSLYYGLESSLDNQSMIMTWADMQSYTINL